MDGNGTEEEARGKTGEVEDKGMHGPAKAGAGPESYQIAPRISDANNLIRWRAWEGRRHI